MEWFGFWIGMIKTILPKRKLIRTQMATLPFRGRPPPQKKNAKFEASLTQALRKHISVSIFISFSRCIWLLFFIFFLSLLSLSTDVAGTKLFVCGVCTCGTCNHHTHILSQIEKGKRPLTLSLSLFQFFSDLARGHPIR
jgi:hypothetical protein